MNYTAYTAVIFTFHHLSALTTVILGSLFGLIIYFLFIRKRHHRLLAFSIIFLMALFLSSFLAEKILHRKPLSIEIVQAG